MEVKTLRIFPEDPDATLTAYVQNQTPGQTPEPRPAVILCPGGAYKAVAPREGEIVLLSYLAAGFQGFILSYSVKERARAHAPLLEACRAVRYVREHAEELNVCPDKIILSGFSAGAHCAASAGVLWNSPVVRAALGENNSALCRPDGLILCYPVITSGAYAHRGSFCTLCGNDPDLLGMYSLEKQVSSDTPPTFLWHTATDPHVPVQNSLLFAQALAENHVPFELHVYPRGTHGLALCDKRTWEGSPGLIEPVAAEWIGEAIRWATELPQ